MATIRFQGVPESHRETMAQVFDLIANGKRTGNLDGEALKAQLGELGARFISSREEADSWLEKIRENPALQMPWDYCSWVDALANSAIDLRELRFLEGGLGELTFEQLAWPSGGIEATEHIVELFGGTVLANDAI